MNRSSLREARITSETCQNKGAVHDYLKSQLGFPPFYGRNLAALADCLAEASCPLLITFAIDAESLPTEMQAYTLRLAQVCARESLANENVNMVIEHPRNR